MLAMVMNVLWAPIAFNGIYAIVKGYFYHEEEKAKKHDPNAYRKWIRFSGVFMVICGLLNIVWNTLDILSEDAGFKYVLLIIITVVVVLAIIGIAYARMVKPADQALGIESEFDKILRENKEKKK